VFFIDYRCAEIRKEVIGLIAATRRMIGFGAGLLLATKTGLLLATKIKRERRKVLGLTLFLSGVAKHGTDRNTRFWKERWKRDGALTGSLPHFRN
jgi:hypothetical protein